MLTLLFVKATHTHTQQATAGSFHALGSSTSMEQGEEKIFCLLPLRSLLVSYALQVSLLRNSRSLLPLCSVSFDTEFTSLLVSYALQVPLYPYMLVSLYVCTYRLIRTHAHTRLHAHVHARTHTHTHTHTHTYPRSETVPYVRCCD